MLYLGGKEKDEGEIMKLKFDINNKNQPDPYIFEDNGEFFLYVTAHDGVEAYETDDIFGEWKYIGVVTEMNEERKNFWAPSIIKTDGLYYIYASFKNEGGRQEMHVFSAESPRGPFKLEKRLYKGFSIDSHVVKNDSGLFMFLALDNLESDKVGTRVYVDRLLDPLTPENKPKEIIVPTFPEEKFTPQCTNERDWYTIEGPFYFYEEGWHYVMYSGGCYQDDTYHIGYAAAKSNEQDLTKIDFIKATKNGGFNPVIIKNEFEEGTGHHSVIKHNGEYYAVYHGRDYSDYNGKYTERRTARICKLNVSNGKITAEQK